jgi:hypothetical protein
MAVVKFIVCAAASEAKAASERSLECMLDFAVDWVVEWISSRVAGVSQARLQKGRMNMEVKKAVSEGEAMRRRADCQYFWPVW